MGDILFILKHIGDKFKRPYWQSYLIFKLCNKNGEREKIIIIIKINVVFKYTCIIGYLEIYLIGFFYDLKHVWENMYKGEYIFLHILLSYRYSRMSFYIFTFR